MNDRQRKIVLRQGYITVKTVRIQMVSEYMTYSITPFENLGIITKI